MKRALRWALGLSLAVQVVALGHERPMLQLYAVEMRPGRNEVECIESLGPPSLEELK